MLDGCNAMLNAHIRGIFGTKYLVLTSETVVYKVIDKTKSEMALTLMVVKV